MYMLRHPEIHTRTKFSSEQNEPRLLPTGRQDQHDNYRPTGSPDSWPTDEVNTINTDRQGHTIIADQQGQNDYYRQTDGMDTTMSDRRSNHESCRPIRSTPLPPTDTRNTTTTDRHAEHDHYRQIGPTRIFPTNKANKNITDGQGQPDYQF